uniref:C2 domain-containing protein n=1 Tax=Globodera rostochiensis TaxID=31243 RepID=A0A914I7D5_GLORO
MEQLAACHLMNGFVHVPHAGNRRGHHASAPSCQHVKRTLSLADRRGLISPARGSARTGASKADDEWEGVARRMHHAGHSFGHMQNWAMLMPMVEANRVLHLPSLEFGAGRRYLAGSRRRGRSAAASARASDASCYWRREQLGQLLVCLQYSQQRLFVDVLRASGLPDASAAPSLLVWLLRADLGALEKRKTANVSPKIGTAPVFNERFVFAAQPDELDNLAVVIMLMDSFAELGHCILGELSGADESGARHWHEAIERPGHTVAEWHRLSAEW